MNTFHRLIFLVMTLMLCSCAEQVGVTAQVPHVFAGGCSIDCSILPASVCSSQSECVWTPEEFCESLCLEVCGDGTCSGSENELNCTKDCAPESTCGNGVCDAHENCSSCEEDCICGPGRPYCRINMCVECLQDLHCTSDTESCVDNVCVGECTPESIEVSCAKRECGQVTNNCGEEVDCGMCEANEVCQIGLCQAMVSCSTDTDCPPTELCIDNVCQLSCEWIAGEYGDCVPVSDTCDSEGIRTRSVSCACDSCVGEQPASSELCQLDNCDEQDVSDDDTSSDNTETENGEIEQPAEDPMQNPETGDMQPEESETVVTGASGCSAAPLSIFWLGILCFVPIKRSRSKAIVAAT